MRQAMETIIIVWKQLSHQLSVPDTWQKLNKC